MTAKLIEIRAIKDKRYPMPISETIPVTLTKPTGPITESATFFASSLPPNNLAKEYMVSFAVSTLVSKPYFMD